MKKGGPLLIPGTTLITFAVNVALPSSSGTAAAVGGTMIPLLIASGVHPMMAGASVFAGTWGSVLSPGLAHNPFIAEMSGKGVMEVIAIHAPATLSSVLACSLVLMAVAIYRKEYKGYVIEHAGVAGNGDDIGRVNPLFALMPIIPISILILGASGQVPVLEMGVPQAMLTGIILTLIITRANLQTVTTEFFNGMGKAYGDVLGIIIAATVFAAGMDSMGMLDAFISWLADTPGAAKLGTTIGPFLLAIIMGTGDAAAFAFNEAITPSAESFGMGIANMGGAVAVAGAIGRTMSPLAGPAIVCAGIAGVNTLDLAKRTAPGMIVALVVLILVL